MHGRRKNHVGRLMPGNRVAPARQNYANRKLAPLVFGMAIKHANDGNTEDRMFHVLRRDESTLRAIVLRHIRPGTSDGQVTNQITSPNHKSLAKLI